MLAPCTGAPIKGPQTIAYAKNFPGGLGSWSSTISQGDGPGLSWCQRRLRFGIYAVFLPYGPRPSGNSSAKRLILLALPRGLLEVNTAKSLGQRLDYLQVLNESFDPLRPGGLAWIDAKVAIPEPAGDGRPSDRRDRVAPNKVGTAPAFPPTTLRHPPSGGDMGRKPSGPPKPIKQVSGRAARTRLEPDPDSHSGQRTASAEDWISIGKALEMIAGSLRVSIGMAQVKLIEVGQDRAVRSRGHDTDRQSLVDARSWWHPNCEIDAEQNELRIHPYHSGRTHTLKNVEINGDDLIYWLEQLKHRQIIKKSQVSPNAVAVPPSTTRKTGPRAYKLSKVIEAMRADITAGKLNVRELESMLEKDLAPRYRVSRDTARKARNAVLSEFVDRQTATNDK